MIRFLVVWLFMVFASANEATAKFKLFQDADLKTYLEKNKQGVIYTVSPHMYLSLKGLAEYKAIAQKHGVSFLALIDPNADSFQNPLNVDLKGLSKLNSKELISKNAAVHFPAFIFHKNGKLLGSFNPGYDAPEKFEQRLTKALKP